MEHQLDESILGEFNTRFGADPKNLLAQNLVTQATDVLYTQSSVVGASITHDFSKKLKTEAKCANQKSSGRCWIFAALNVARQRVIEKYNLEPTFELSQNYVAFFDKLEKANFALQMIIETAKEDIGSRLVQHLLQSPVNDGGQWSMLQNVVLKYGLVPKSAFPETGTSGATARVNRLVTNKIREFAKKLREMVEAEASPEELVKEQKQMMEIIHRILTIHLGTPPTVFDWEYVEKSKDKEAKHHTIEGLTPLQFAKDFVDFDFEATVSVINDPRNKYYQTYTVDKLNNVVGGRPVLYLNLPIDVISAMVTASIDKGDAVWFGCDCGKCFSRQHGALSTELFVTEELLYGTSWGLDKKDRLLYGESLMTHAMVFTGYHKVGEGPVKKFRVENSWGDKYGSKGYLMMTKQWFDEFVYQVVVKKDLITEEMEAALKLEPIVLPPWDPMGALATK